MTQSLRPCHGVMVSRCHGVMARWGGLSRQVHDMGDLLASLDRRYLATETTLQRVVSHGQLADTIRSTFGQFRGQVITTDQQIMTISLP